MIEYHLPFAELEGGVENLLLGRLPKTMPIAFADADGDRSKSDRILERNSQFIPGGMASLNRATNPPLAFARAVGAYMWDVDGKRYIDYHAGFAPYLLGHNDPDVNRAVFEVLEGGVSNFGTGPTELEGQLAELFLRCVSTAEKVQFFNSGSEATSQAIRVARAFTGRDHIIGIQGGYNGNQNVVAFNMMNTAEQLGGRPANGGEYPIIPMTAGIPALEQTLLHAVEYNDLDAVDAIAQRYPIAALITEPVLQNIGVVKPREGYLRGLRELADRHGFILIFDEVKTGFRSAIGGFQSLSGVTPDLSTFGKAMANGYPIAALAGKKDLLDLSICNDPKMRVLVAGTYNAHPVPVAASIACISKLINREMAVYKHLECMTERLTDGMRSIIDRRRIPAVVVSQGSAHVVYFMEQEPQNWWQLVTNHNFDFDSRYRNSLIERGVYYFPTPTKQGSISFAHRESDIDATLAAIDDSLRALHY